MGKSNLKRKSKILFLSYTTFHETQQKGKDERFLKMHGPVEFFDEVHLLHMPTQKNGVEEPFSNFYVHNTHMLGSNNRIFRDLGYIKILKKAVEIVKNENIDIIEALNPYLPGLVGSLTEKLTDSTYVLYLLNDYDYSLKSQGKGIFERTLGEIMERLNISSASKVFVLSPFLKEYAVKHGAEPEDVKVIPLGVDLDTFQKDENSRKEIRSEFDANEDDLLILFVGRLAGQKDPLTLLRIYKKVREIDKNFKLIVVGDGPLRGEMEDFIKKEKLDDVKFTGFVEHDKVASIMNASDVFLLPTLHEGFGNVFIEAQASGLPIVTTDIPHTREIVDEDNALLFEPGDADEGAKQVLKLRDNNLRKTLSEKGLESAKEFSLEKRHERLKRAHAEILGLGEK